MLVDEWILLPIDADQFYLGIVHSKSGGSKKSNDFFLLILVLLGMHLKEVKKNNYQFFE